MALNSSFLAEKSILVHRVIFVDHCFNKLHICLKKLMYVHLHSSMDH